MDNNNHQQQQQLHKFKAVASSSALPEMDEPSPSDAPDLLEDAYEYVKAQEESGYGDPLIGDNCENFDILQYIGGSETPEDAFCGAPSSYHHSQNLHHYQQTNLQQQQQHPLLGANTSELVHALQSQGPLQQKDCVGSDISHHHAQQILLDSPGLGMYNGGAIAPSQHHSVISASIGPFGSDNQHQVIMGRPSGRTRLPDSPPITDISGGASSISPSSSGGGCDSASPFSPDQFQYVHSQLGNTGIFVHPHHQQQQRHLSTDDMLLANQMHLMGTTTNGAQGGRMLLRGVGGAQSTDVPMQLFSPHSTDFLSPYPPSQSTPGSQHSSQVSPPAISQTQQQQQGGRTINYLINPNQPAHPALSVAGSFASMDNLYIASTDAINGNGASMEQQHLINQQQHYRQQQEQQAPSHGHKRRRMSSSAAAPGSHESLPLNTNNNNNNNLPNIKSEVGAAVHQQQTNFGNQHRSKPTKEPSIDSQHQNNNMLLQAQQQQQQNLEDLDENMNLQRTIKFEPYAREHWATLYDANRQPLPAMQTVVVADKGFNFSSSDGCFVNQKKNHFQITVNIGVNPTAAGSPTSSALQMPINAAQPATPDPFTPRFCRIPGSQQLLPILNQEFMLSFCGVKSEMTSCEVRIKQSQTDRKPIDHEPVKFLIDGSSTSVKQTVPRLHFSETTLNNHRKNGKPNPEQKYFLLVVKLLVNTSAGQVLIQAHQSDRVIVRASNPGQFESGESEPGFKQQNGALTCAGPVCIGADKPVGDALLTVNGPVVVTGQFTRPSDRRVKEDIADLSTTDAMSRVASMRLVEYAYKPEMAQKWGLSEQDRHRVGVIAQELAEVLPEAVRDNGEFLTVDDTRIFYDTVAAAQELYRLTGNLECKIGQVEKISQKLARHAVNKKMMNGSMLSGLSGFTSFLGGTNANNAGAFDNKSCVSYSRTSLTSTGTNNNEEGEEAIKNDDDGDRKRSGRWGRSDRAKRGGGQHRCRAYSSASAYCNNRSPMYCNGPESTLCNSKFTQGTIVTLVVIMALCLMAMCTLYVMDWYNRTYVFPSHFHHYPGHFAHPDATQPMLPDRPPPMNIIDQWNSSWTPPIQNVPALTVFCGSSALASLVSGPFAPSCPQYCCAHENTYYERFGEKISQSVDSLVALASKLPSLLPKTKTTEKKNIQHEFGHGIKIEILNLNNVTLDSRYCLSADDNCSQDRKAMCMPSSCSKRNGRFDLYIPMSPHLPTMPLQLRISIDNPTLVVENCGSLPGFKQCNFDNELNPAVEEGGKRIQHRPRSYQVMDNVFELTAASFLQSAYKFRIGHSTQMCEQDEKQRGRSFDEFNLIFYRTCAQQENAAVRPEVDEANAGNNSETLSSTTPLPFAK